MEIKNNPLRDAFVTLTSESKALHQTYIENGNAFYDLFKKNEHKIIEIIEYAQNYYIAGDYTRVLNVHFVRPVKAINFDRLKFYINLPWETVTPYDYSRAYSLDDLTFQTYFDDDESWVYIPFRFLWDDSWKDAYKKYYDDYMEKIQPISDKYNQLNQQIEQLMKEKQKLEKKNKELRASLDEYWREFHNE